MKANLKGLLQFAIKRNPCCEHRGVALTRKQVIKVCEYGIRKGYESTDDLTDSEVDEVLKEAKGNNNGNTKLFN